MRIAVAAALMLMVQASAGCNGSPPVRPSPVLSITGISPNVGSHVGGTTVRVTGSGFQSATRLTVDAVAVASSFVNSTVLEAVMPAHAAGQVDIAVTNPTGDSAKLPGGYSYIVVPAPAVREVSPSAGSIEGDTWVTLRGSGFSSGAMVVIGGVSKRPYVPDSTTMVVVTPAHTAGTVPIVVTNPDGQVSIADYQYVAPDTFDFNGEWEGTAGPELEIGMRFVVRNDTLISVSCGSSATHSFAAPVPVTAGNFSTGGSGSISMSGKIVAATQATGTITIPSCGSTVWRAAKRTG